MVLRLMPEEGVLIGLGAQDETRAASSCTEGEPSLSSWASCRQEASSSGESRLYKAGRGCMVKVFDNWQLFGVN